MLACCELLSLVAKKCRQNTASLMQELRALASIRSDRSEAILLKDVLMSVNRAFR